MTGEPQRPEDKPLDITVADAVRGNWVDLYAPTWSKPYLRLSRADRPVGTWLLFLPCVWGIFLALNASEQTLSLYSVWLIVGCGLGAFLMRGAGCTWNDLSDQDFDAQVARTRSRPLPSGAVTRKAAYVWLLAQVALAGGILLTFPWPAIALGIAALVPVAFYPFAKRVTWWPQLVLGIAINWGVLVGWAAVAGGLSLAPLVLFAAGIFWTLFYDTIYAHQDREDDAVIGVKSTARLFGDATVFWLWGFASAATCFMGLGAFLANSFAGLTMLAFGAHLGWQILRLDIDDPARCLALFRSNQWAGLIPALFFAISLSV